MWFAIQFSFIFSITLALFSMFCYIIVSFYYRIVEGIKKSRGEIMDCPRCKEYMELVEECLDEFLYFECESCGHTHYEDISNVDKLRKVG